jgi:hypothetical protein
MMSLTFGGVITAQGRPVLVYRIGATDVIALKNEFPETLIKRKHVQVFIVVKGRKTSCLQFLPWH